MCFAGAHSHYEALWFANVANSILWWAFVKAWWRALITRIFCCCARMVQSKHPPSTPYSCVLICLHHHHHHNGSQRLSQCQGIIHLQRSVVFCK